MNKQDIKNIFGQIETPEYNPADDIKQKINQGYKIKQKMPQTKRTVIIIAAIMTVIILMSATEYFAKIKVFDLEGNSYIIDIPYKQMSEEPTTAVNDEYIHRTVEDYDELIKYMDGEIFKLPQYIPDGYEFSSAAVNFFNDGNPDNLKSIFVSYVKQGVFISYNIELFAPESINMIFGGLEDTECEILQMPQFYRNILLSRDFNLEENSGEFLTHTFLALNSIPVMCGDIGNEYGTVQYSISSFSITRDEIIKMAESIK